MLTTARHQQGMTLIEIMVALAVFGLLVLMAAPSFSTWIQNTRIRTTAESIQNGVQTARTEALKRNTAVEFALTSLLAAGTDADWVVRCVTAVDDLDGDGVADCPGAAVAPAPSVTPDAITQRPATEGSRNVVITSANTTIAFLGTGRVTPTPAAVIAINVTNPSAGSCVADSGSIRCLRVTVSPGGQVRMCDPAFSSSDPRGC